MGQLILSDQLFVESVIDYIELYYNDVISDSSNEGQMSRQIDVRWNLEWNGIVQGCYIQYSTNDLVPDNIIYTI